jgi:hypothetical protein
MPSKAHTQSSASPNDELLTYFERTALPIQRIELQLSEIEATAKAAKAQAEVGMEARQAKADHAWSTYGRILGLEKDEHALKGAANAFEKAMNAVRSPVWFAAREALINVDLARKALEADKGDEAVEAAMRAVKAWWRMRTRQYERPLRYGFEGIQARSKGGKKRAEMMAREVADRNANIQHVYAGMIEAGYPRSDAVKILATRYEVLPSVDCLSSGSESRREPGKSAPSQPQTGRPDRPIDQGVRLQRPDPD